MRLVGQDVCVQPRLGPLTVSARAGECVHVVGPNGAGKSTLLSVLAGLQPTAGRVMLDGEPLWTLGGQALARHRAWLPQQQPVPGTLPVWHYLRMHLVAGSTQVDAVLHGLAEQLGLDDKLTRKLTQLSGGEWQRVRLAAVTLQIHPDINPLGRVLILDEPMSALDVAQQGNVDNVIRSLCQSGIAVIASSHDLNHTLRRADRVWLLQHGKLVAEGPAAQVLNADALAAVYQTRMGRVDTPQGPILYPL